MKFSQLKKIYEEALKLVEIEEYSKAIELFNKIIMKEERIKEVWMNKGVAFAKMGKYDEAISSLREAIKIDENYKDAWMNIARALVESGRFEEALEAYDKLISLGDSKKWRLEKGITLYKAERYEEAVEVFSSLEDVDAMIYSALSLSKIGRFDEAIEFYRKALEKDPKNEIALNNVVTLFMRLERWDDATKLLKKLREMNPSTEVLRHLSSVLMLSKDYKSALEVFEDLLQKNKDDEDVYYNSALCHFFVGDLEKAKRLVDKAIELNPYAGDSWLLRARIHDEMKNEKGAEYSVKRAIQLDEKLRKIVEKDEKLSKYLD